MDNKHICSICGKEFDGFGNNAEPVNDGLCCDKCNNDIVIPRRLADIGKKKSIDVKKRVESFLDDIYKIKFDMLLKAQMQEVADLGNVSNEFIDKLFDEASRKMYDVAKSKLDDEVVQCIMTDYVGIVKDDLELVFTLYEIVHGKKFKLAGFDLDMLFE